MTDEKRSTRSESSNTRTASGRRSRGKPGGRNQRSGEHEPLSLAEEIAKDIQRGKRTGQSVEQDYESLKQGGVNIGELQKMSMADLIEEARKDNLAEVAGMKKQELIFNILKERCS